MYLISFSLFTRFSVCVQFVYACVHNVCAQSLIKWYVFSVCVMSHRQNEHSWNHLDAPCSDKDIRLQIMSICVKAIVICWYYFIQMLIGVKCNLFLKRNSKTQQRASQFIFRLYNFKIPHLKVLPFTYRNCFSHL